MTPLDSRFERLRIGVPPGPARRDADFAIAASRPRRITRRLEHLEAAPSDWSELQLHVPSMSLVSVTGGNLARYSAVVFTEVADEKSVALVEKARWVRRGEVCELKAASDSSDAIFYLDIVGPRDQPLTITGPHAAVDVFGWSAPVSISTAQGRVSVLECSGDVDIRNGTHVVWAGRLGTVRIDAHADMDLKVIDADADGILDATGAQSVRLLLPPAFSGDIEANVGRDDQFVYRAGDRARVHRREERGRLIFTSGSGTPRLRLFSHWGEILIDSTP